MDEYRKSFINSAHSHYDDIITKTHGLEGR